MAYCPSTTYLGHKQDQFSYMFPLIVSAQPLNLVLGKHFCLMKQVQQVFPSSSYHPLEVCTR